MFALLLATCGAFIKNSFAHHTQTGGKREFPLHRCLAMMLTTMMTMMAMAMAMSVHLGGFRFPLSSNLEPAEPNTASQLLLTFSSCHIFMRIPCSNPPAAASTQPHPCLFGDLFGKSILTRIRWKKINQSDGWLETLAGES